MAPNRWLVTFAVMSVTLMQVLDTTIVNVALPNMQGTLGASPDQITWVLTSYLVASAIFMPLTGYMTDRLGRKNYLLLSITGFILTSMLCGAAMSITQIVIFRLLQGMFGAALVPLSQAILTDTFPPEERGNAMAIWGVGVMVGPVLGPTLGGYLTEVVTWRWNFYINIPVGLLSLFIAWKVLPDTPRKERQMDWLGLALISLAIGATQYLFDRGNRADWFNSTEIRIALCAALIGLGGFLVNGYYQRSKSVFNLAIFKDRNFVIASTLLSLFGLGLFGGMVLLPLLLEGIYQYPVMTTGFLMAPRGLSAMFSMFFAGKLMKYVDSRILIIIGTLLCAIGSFPGTYYSTMVNSWWIIWPLLLQGLGLGLLFVPLSAVAFSTLPDHMRAEASGLFSLLRTLGSSIGISVIITVYTRHTQIAWNHLASFVTPYHSAVTQYLHPLHLSMNQPLAATLLGSELAKQAQMVSFVDVYAFIAWSFIVMLPLIFFIKHVHKQQNTTLIVE